MNACSSPRVQRRMRHGRCPSGAHSLLNTGSKLNTVHASWVSTFFYVEKPFHLCLAAIHSSIQMKQQGVGEHALGEPRVEWEAANHLPRKDSLTALHWVCKKEEERSSPSELQGWGHNSSESPSGTHQKGRDKITDISFSQEARPLHQHRSTMPAASWQDWSSLELHFIWKEISERLWF